MMACAECGTSLQMPNSAQGRKGRALLCSPGGWVCVVAGIVALQGLLRLAFTPYDAALGEGNHERATAAMYCWLSLAIGLVLFAYGFYLLRRKADE